MSGCIRSRFLKVISYNKTSVDNIWNQSRGLRGRIYRDVEAKRASYVSGEQVRINPHHVQQNMILTSSQETKSNIQGISLTTKKLTPDVAKGLKSSNFPKLRKMEFEACIVTEENKFTRLSETVTPLYHLPYEKQLQFKYENCMKILRHLGSEITKTFPSLPLTKNRLPCELEHVRPCPVLDHYRNYDEFSVGPGVAHRDHVIGLYIGRPTNSPDEFCCVEPTHLNIVKTKHVQVAMIFQEYIRSSALPPYSLTNHDGYWRNLCVRSNQAGDLMVSVILHPQGMTEEELEMEKESIHDFLISGPGKDCNITSLFLQTSHHTRSTHQQSPFQLLHGQPHITETLGDMIFKILPDALFQRNTYGAEVLYEAIEEVVNPSDSTTLLDIRCGAGIVSLYLSKKMEKCIGIDLSKVAINEAKVNAEFNGVSNCTFLAGQPQNIVPDLFQSLYSKDLVVIVNATRGAINDHLLLYLRSVKHIHRIIYVFYKPEANTFHNFTQLCSPSKSANSGRPFLPVKAIPVDMLPQTQHCEMVLVFERVP